MKAIKFAVVILALSAVSAMATDGVVTWSIDMPKTVVDPNVDTYFDFFVNVDVTGNNQGLAIFQNDIAITKLSGPGAGGYIVGHPTAFDWGAYWTPYKSPSTAVHGTIVDPASAGGPGLTTLPQLGDLTFDGFIDDIGAGILDWNPVRQEGKVWAGVQQWGVGLASRKADLLVNPAGDYLVNYGYWTVGDFVAAQGGMPAAAGTYKIELLPVSAAVLLAEKDLNLVDSGVTALADGINGASVIFTIVPEPATMLLLAGAGAFIRRRRHA
jgi:hypothetical protein